jgi:hypothetical protein
VIFRRNFLAEDDCFLDDAVSLAFDDAGSLAATCAAITDESVVLPNI